MTNDNTGHRNTGDLNTGNRNSGNLNTGNRNTGDRNSGDLNTGDYNSGHLNTGNRNSGDYNSGHWNTGDYNTGDYNSGDLNTGFFMTTTPDTVPVFNGNTHVDRHEFVDALPAWLRNVSPVVWVPGGDMTDQQKQENPDWETVGGYLLERSMHEAYAEAWNKSDRDIEAVRGIPGFDYDVWTEITGIEFDEPEVTEATPPETVVVGGFEYELKGKAS